ncbi:MAG: hypothetical protein Q4G68_04945 [Planctomycetia bacterium]|nr:hypothetical protein [Planctomycetia bacterium]
MRFYQTVLLCLIVLSFTSCGENRQEMQGTATWNHEPIPMGCVTFIPVDQDVSRPSIASITNGKFQIPARFGLLPGTYKVTVEAYDGVPQEDLPAGKKLFPGYQVEYQIQETDRSLDINVPLAPK